MTAVGSLITEMFQNFGTVITGLAGGLKDAFSNLLYVDPSAANPVVSPLVYWIFGIAAIGIASGILYKIFSMVRARKGN